MNPGHLEALAGGAQAKVTSECPPPPFYWSLENLQTVLRPPAPPDGDSEAVLAAISGEYGGVVRNLQRRHKFDPLKNYQALLSDQLQRLADKALSIASHVPQIPAPVPGVVAQHEALAQLNDILVEMHDTLGEYRTHEARENIIKTYKAELARLARLEADLQAAGQLVD